MVRENIFDAAKSYTEAIVRVGKEMYPDPKIKKKLCRKDCAGCLACEALEKLEEGGVERLGSLMEDACLIEARNQLAEDLDLRVY